jgi:hypothetical protein
VTARPFETATCVLVIAVAAGCAHSDDPVDVGLEGLVLAAVQPKTIIPGSTLAIEGDSFVDAPWGRSHLRLRGRAGGAAIDVRLPAAFVDYDHMSARVTGGFVDELGGDVDFLGDAIMEVESVEDGRLYASEPLPIALSFRRQLTPAPSQVQTGGLVFVNDELRVDGSGFLLGGTEGDTVAIVGGCFTPETGGPCAPISPIEVPVTPAAPFSREVVTFRFVPAIAGIRPGTFLGDVRFENRPAEGSPTASGATPVSYDLITSQIFRINPSAVSLGQYVFVEGGGFVGGEPAASTLLRLVGTFTLTGGPGGVPVDMVLVPEFVAGTLVRYVISEDDSLGRALDLRQDTGTFTGTVTPVVSYRGVEVTGEATRVTLAIAPVKQVVYLDYRPSYVESLRMFGLRAVDSSIRARIDEVLADAYPAINIEFRQAPVDDFAQYAHVELHGPDPNGLGLFGYDNTPGKDSGNQRLYDRLGGVNASTQQDGYPGYGGVFIESLMGFSTHPATGSSIPGADPVFDQVFDPVRPDRGRVVTGADLADGLPRVGPGDCPASGRAAQIACAIRVIGSLIGTTLAHEIGHSLGLANPHGEGFHNSGDAPSRLMDGGSDRPFLERAELGGHAAAQFCDDEYAYLRTILPSSLPPDPSPRPGCY